MSSVKCTPIRMAKATGTPLMVGIQNGTVQQSLKELNILSPHDPAIMLFGIFSMELKTCVLANPCTGMLWPLCS